MYVDQYMKLVIVCDNDYVCNIIKNLDLDVHYVHNCTVFLYTILYSVRMA